MTAIPSSARAAVLRSPRTPLEIVDVEVPAPLEPGAILVRTTAATVCASDVHLWRGEVEASRAGADSPRILGHEMTGTIADFGEGPHVDSVGQPLRIGDRIVWTHGTCGRCRQCVIEAQPMLCAHRQRFSSEPCTAFPFLTGGLAEYCYVYPTSGRVRVPDDVSDVAAAASSCALRSMVHAFDRLGAIDDHHRVLIQGSGPLGLFATALASTTPAAEVIVIGGPPARLELAARWGASLTIDIDELATAEQRIAAVRDRTEGRGAEVVIEVSGVPAAFEEGMALLRPGGRYLVVGQAGNRPIEFVASSIVFKQATIIGSLSAGVEHYWRALEFMRRHRDRFDWDSMITGRYVLDDVNSAFERMASWEEIKPAVVFE